MDLVIYQKGIISYQPSKYEIKVSTNPVETIIAIDW